MIGIIIGIYLKDISLYFCVLEIGLLIIFIILKIKKKNNKVINKILLSVLILIISIKQVSILENKYEKIETKLDYENIKVEGIVQDIYQKNNSYIANLLLEKENIKVLIYIKNYDKESIKYGDKIEVIGKYNKPEVSRNYKGFDYKEYLKTQNIVGSISCTFNDIKIVSKNNYNIFLKIIYDIKQFINNKIEQNVDIDNQKLLSGVLIGDKNNLDKSIINDFKNSNLSHMLAVSGTHVGYVILLLTIIIKDKKVGKRLSIVLKIFFILIFILLVGGTPSVIRSGVSAIIYLFAFLAKRKKNIKNAIIIPIIISLIINPYNILNVGMQLSYLGTIGILLFNKYIEKTLRKIIKIEKIESKNKLKIIYKIFNYLISIISISLSANVLIIPIMIYKFNSISLTFLLSNILAAPVLCLIILIGFISIFLSIININIGFFILNLLLELIKIIAKFCGNILFSKIQILTPDLIWVIITYIILLLIYFYLERKNEYKFRININKKIIIFLTIIFYLLATIFSFNIIFYNGLKIYFIDVGQGDSALIISESGKKILVDGGGSKAGSNYDVGENITLPYLLDRKIMYIDYIFCSHFDSDHVQGLEAVLENIKVDKLILTKQMTISENYKKIVEICNRKKVKVIEVKEKDILKIDNKTTIQILAPDINNFIDDGKGGLNSNAIVFKLIYKLNNNKNITALFTGDIEEKTEKSLVEKYGKKLKADILKVAHHGSKTSSISEFLELVKPQIALIGVGKNNSFGHPNDGVIQRLDNLKTRIFRTDEMGEIDIKINNNGDIKIDKKIN